MKFNLNRGQFEILKHNFTDSRDMLVDLNVNTTRIQVFEKNWEENGINLALSQLDQINALKFRFKIA